VETELQRVADFVPERDGRYQAFHRSVTDWLLGTVGRSRRFRVNAQHGHQLLAEQCWQEHRHGADAMSEYAVRHALYHLHHAGRPEDEARVTIDPGFIHRRIQLGRGIFLSHSYRTEHVDLVAEVTEGLRDKRHTLLVGHPADTEEGWRRQVASTVPSASIAIGFAYTRNSRYLREEWLVARASGVPLLLIIAEDSPWLSQTPALATVPCFDMREWRDPAAFSAAWSGLVALVGDGREEDPPPPGVIVDVRGVGMVFISKSASDGESSTDH
jgi:hypothetical protein